MILKTLTFEEKMILFLFKMDEAWPNTPSLEIDTWYLEILNFFFFFFFEKMMMMTFLLFFFFFEMNEAWLNAPSLRIDAWLLKTLTFEEKMMLGSKDLGTNVFRTLMCNVGKPWSKQALVLFRLTQSVCVVCKVRIEWLQKY